jgi:hypothetical protein
MGGFFSEYPCVDRANLSAHQSSLAGPFQMQGKINSAISGAFVSVFCHDVQLNAGVQVCEACEKSAQLCRHKHMGC